MGEAYIFDRDGTLIEDRHYISSPCMVRPIPGMREKLIRLQRDGAKLFIVSNQSGIRRGYFSRERLMEIDRHMKRLFHPVRFEATFYCTHHPSERCSCRKPSPYFLWKISRIYGFSPDRMTMVGDTHRDRMTAEAFGIRFLFVDEFLSL